MRTHWDNGKRWGAPCGFAWRDRRNERDRRSERGTTDRGCVTCRICRQRADEFYASQRDGFDYRRARYEERRRRGADRREAERIVLDRHAEEVEMELALVRLARFGREAS